MPAVALLVLILAPFLAPFLAVPPAPAAASAAAAPAWRLPVRGEVTGAFAYDERHPFAAGQRRGVDIAAGPRAIVRSACGGRVRYAGRVPRRGLGVSLRCGRLTATHLGLGHLAVRRGDRVRRGQRVGRAGPSGVVRLGARVTARPFGWIDPLGFVEAHVPPREGPPPLGRAPLSRRPPPLPATRRVPAPAARRVRLPRPSADRGVPALAWLGAALLAAGLPLGAVITVRRRGRERVRRERAAAPAG